MSKALRRAVWLVVLTLFGTGLPPAGARAAEVAGALLASLDRDPRVAQAVWVHFSDKGPDVAQRIAEGPVTVSPRALARRALRGGVTSGATLEDASLDPGYVAAVEATGARVRHQLRWLNAMSVEADARQVKVLAGLPFVRRVEAVRRGRRDPPPAVSASVAAPRLQPAGVHALDYGESFEQLEQLHVPPLHDLGFDGSGVIVAVFDTGFDHLAHEALAGLQILATRDVVNGDEDVADGIDLGSGGHGTATLSVLAGYAPGQLIGPAWGAAFILAKTENTESETPVEEDHWAAAAEWAEALGADVISSSLGYTLFDAPFGGYAPEQLDGLTAVSTRAADMAANRGVVVVNSAGNGGVGIGSLGGAVNTLGAPADGHLVLAAGGVTASGRRSAFSSVGPSADGRIKPDLAARATAVRAALGPFAQPYGLVNGTSFACPLVAGVVALVLQAHPEYTVPQVHAALRTTASQAAAPDNLLGWGIVDALAAVQADVPAPEPAGASREGSW
jgi:subtilisin family serine protease